MVEPLNTIARLWWDWSAAMLWQAGLLILLVGCVDLLIRKWAWPQLRYALWTLILIKLVLPPTLSLPSAIVPGLEPAVRQAVRLMNTDKPTEKPTPIADFGLRIADLSPNTDLQLRTVRLPSQASVLSAVESEISDLRSDANPQSEIRNPQFIWQVYAMFVWLAGTLTLGIWLSLRLHSFCSRHASQAAAASLPQSFYNQMADCANRLGLRHVPRVVVTKRLASPAVFGAIRPVLLMPKGYLSQLSRRDTEHMLLHELAHVKRGDLIMHSLYMLLQIAYWYNPLLWLVRRQMHHLRELSCDATVANLLRERTTAYRQTLLETARRLLSASVETQDVASLPGLLGLFEDSNRLLVRLNWLTKPTWRYRTMKRAIVVTIAALMIACVLPMARAQEASSDSKRIVNDEIVRVNVQDRDQLSQDEARRLKDLQRRLDQMMDQQKALADQLRELAARRDVASQRESSEQADPSSHDLDSLQKHLEEMTIQQKVLQEQLRALAEGRRERQREPAGPRPRRERMEIREDIDVEVSPREAPQREGAESADRIKRDQIKREEIRIEKERSLDAARRAEADARKAQFEAQRQHAEKMKAWGEEMRQWEHSEPMVKWRAQMEKWQQQMQEWAHSLAPGERDGEHASPDVAPVPSTPPMPPMPAMPKMPGDGKEKMKMKLKNADPMYGDADPMYEEAQEDLAEADEDVEEEAFAVEVPHVAPPHVNPPHVEIPVIEPPAPPHVSEDQGEIVSKSSFGDIAGDRILEVENFVGSITVRSGDGSEYEVHAVTRVKADTKERIREIAEQLSIADTGAQPNGVERIIVSKPEGLKDRENVTVTIEVVAPREARIKLHQEVGEIRLHGLRGSIEAATRVGSIRAVDVAGRVALDTDVGGIDIAVPKDVSAKIQAKADLGGIQSDLPLEFTKAGGMSMGSSAVGTIGQGDDSISLKAKMGSIRIRSQAPESGRTGGGRPARSQPRPDPRPEPQPTEVF